MPDGSTNDVEVLTEDCDRYIVGDVVHLASSTAQRMVLARTNHASFTNVVWVYQYLFQGEQKQQKSLHKWTFYHKVRHFFFHDDAVYFLMYNGNRDEHLLERMQLDPPSDSTVGFRVCLDKQRTVEMPENR